MMMIMIENDIEANILMSKVRKPPQGLEFPGPEILVPAEGFLASLELNEWLLCSHSLSLSSS